MLMLISIKLITINGIILIINVTRFKKATIKQEQAALNKQLIEKTMIWFVLFFFFDVNGKSTQM